MIFTTMANDNLKSSQSPQSSLPGKASGSNMFLVDEVLFCSHDREVVLHCSRIILGMEVDLGEVKVNPMNLSCLYNFMFDY